MNNTQNIERDEMGLIPPYGGVLKQLILSDKDKICLLYTSPSPRD